MDGSAGVQGVLPAGLERVLQLVAHPVRRVGVEATHAGHLVAEALLGEDLGDAIFGHPRLVAVPESVRRQAGSQREPAGKWGAFRDRRDAATARRRETGVLVGVGPSLWGAGRLG